MCLFYGGNFEQPFGCGYAVQEGIVGVVVEVDELGHRNTLNNNNAGNFLIFDQTYKENPISTTMFSMKLLFGLKNHLNKI
jgi:hypothetical protein